MNWPPPTLCLSLSSLCVAVRCELSCGERYILIDVAQQRTLQCPYNDFYPKTGSWECAEQRLTYLSKLAIEINIFFAKTHAYRDGTFSLEQELRPVAKSAAAIPWDSVYTYGLRELNCVAYLAASILANHFHGVTTLLFIAKHWLSYATSGTELRHKSSLVTPHPC